MRTTLTIDDDLAARIRAEQARTKRSLKDVINRALRAGLGGGKPETPRRYRVRSYRLGFKPAIDPYRLNQLVDDLEVDDFIEEAGR